MVDRQSVAGGGAGDGMLVLGVDTCGPTGSVALARIGRPSPEFSRSSAWEFGQLAKLLAQITLEGRTYSATLIAAVDELLTGHGVGLGDIGAIVVVHGPGSFTGIRVGVSAVKGLAEPGQIPVVAVSRLAVLAAKAGVGSAALDAHRHEVFLRAAGADGSSRQLLAGAEELAEAAIGIGGMDKSPVPKGEGPGVPTGMVSQVSEELIEGRSPVPKGEGPGAHRVAVCEEAAEGLLRAAWPGVGLVRVEAPTAADAIGVCVPAILAGEFADLALLDGHYLRRSDAEIFGDAVQKR